jgi:pimeloyl-ACP methyl ester carboxylesterase
MELPELVLVHGAWHGAWEWSRLLPVLAERGWKARAVDLPSAGGSQGIVADGELLRGVLEESSAPKVVVGHSYGGTVVTQGSSGVDSVVGLAYICAARPDVGEVVWNDPRSPDEVPYWIEVDFETEGIHARHSEKILYNDCSPDVVAWAQAQLKPQSLASFLEPVSAAGWRERPYAYLICDDDQCVPAAGQEELAEGAGRIERIPASHSPFLSRPGEVEEFLRRAAADFVAQA